MNAPLFKVLKGNPSDDEVAALTTLLSQLDADARAKAADTRATRDLWGQPGDTFNPSAFRNVRYF
ncbi:acyl-CoA carboxylase subunit epsilon [Corynebacterium sp.]|uniref:acyl-CoA carboxylase subunit epsilon n=1 Tax=Corynebacterium sp. TaxID=1720 RepID=UPI0026DD96EF|nr:acyl-CoA carboxylase subunit epsilon [Corynebacterium sp.]MDO5031150.1 acyl-CoA carboxylase subunit epsilon [Corynebacterium sp.]